MDDDSTGFAMQQALDSAPKDVQDVLAPEMKGSAGSGGSSSFNAEEPGVFDKILMWLGITAEVDWTKDVVDNASIHADNIGLTNDSSGNLHLCYGSSIFNSLWYGYYNGTWYTEQVATQAKQCEIIVNSTGVVHIVYLEWSADQIRHARGSFGSWATELVENNINGDDSKPDIFQDSTSTLHLSYVNRTGNELRYAVGTWGAWNTEALTYTVNNPTTSIVVNSTNDVHIFTHDSEEDLQHAYGSFGAWNYETVDCAGGDKCYYPSAAIDSSDEIHVVYSSDKYDGDDTNMDLRYANGTTGNWDYWEIDNATTGEDFYYEDIIFDGNGNKWVSYAESGGVDIKFANGTAGTWTTQYVEKVGGLGYSTGAARNGSYAHLAYLDNTNDDVRHAYREIGVAGGGPGPGGTNCTCNVSYDTPTYSGSDEQFNITCNYSQVTYPNASFELEWNGTDYTMILIESAGDIHTWAKTLTMPVITSYQAIEFLINASNVSGVCNYTINYTQEIYPISIDNCDVNTQVILNVSHWDEINISQTLNMSLEINFQFLTLSGVETDLIYNFSEGDAPFHDFCLPAGYSETVVTDVEMYYYDSAEDYAPRMYYLSGYTLNSSAPGLLLYSLSENKSQTFELTLFDSDYTKLPDHYIQTLRYYVDEVAYRVVEVSKTDYLSKTINHMELEPPYYRFIILDNDGTVIYITESSKAYCTVLPCEKNIFVRDDNTTYLYHQTYPDVTYTLTWNSSGTNLVAFTYVDPTGETDWGRLWVYQRNYTSDDTICNTTVAAASATILCNLSTYVAGDGTFLANVYISRSPEKWFDQITTTFAHAWEVYGLEGVVWAIFILGMIGLTAIWNPTATIIMSVFGMILIKFVGLINIPWAVIVGAIVVGIILIWRSD